MQILSNLFPGTHYAEAIRQLEELYKEADEKISEWKKISSLGCAPGCGLCCSKFEPEVLTVETDYVALYICYKKPELLESLASYREEKHCLFYDHDNSEHCRIYPARSLLCRLFAFSALSDKDNNPAFHLCTYIEPELMKRIYKGKEIEEYFQTPLPLMQDYSIRLNSINAGADNTPLPFRRSIFQAINKVQLLAGLTAF